MKHPQLPLALTTLVLVASAGMAAAQPLPHSSFNQAERRLHLVDPSRTVLHAGQRACVDDLCLEVTLSLADPDNPSACGTQTELEVAIGDAVNICYRMTNHSAHTLGYHTLVDSVVGTLFNEHVQSVAPHQTYQHNRVIVASTNPNATHGVFESTWTAATAQVGYDHDTGTEPFIDISGSGTALVLSDDGAGVASADYPVRFFEETANQVCVGNNGGLYIGTSTCSGFPHSNRGLPASNLNAPAIAPFWDDLMAGGSVYYETIGAAPDRRFVVSWHNKPNYGDTGSASGQHGATFQVVFEEASENVVFNYQTTTFGGSISPSYDHGGSATVGVQRDTATSSQFSHDTQSLSDGLSIRWSLRPREAFTVTAEAAMDVGAPAIVVAPDASEGLAATVATGATTTQPVVIGNLGNRPLHWQFLRADDSRAHFPATDRDAVAAMQAVLGQTMPIPGKAGNRVRGSGDSVPAYALWNKATPDYVAFDVMDATNIQPIMTGPVLMFAADFVDDDFSQQYAVTAWDNNPRLFRIDTLTGVATLVAPVDIPLGRNPYGAAWDPVSREFYVIAPNMSNGITYLYTVDLETGQASLIGEMPDRRVNEIAIDTQGLMYGVDVISGQLIAIDKQTASVQAIGALGVSLNFSQGLDFDDETGILYLLGTNGSAVSNQAYTVDTESGAVTLIGPTFGEAGGFAIAKSGLECVTPETVPWLGWDVGEGTVLPDPTEMATVAVSFDADGLAPGDYTANLCIFSNDRARARVVLPVQLSVTEFDDTLFKNGFEVIVP